MPKPEPAKPARSMTDAMALRIERAMAEQRQLAAARQEAIGVVLAAERKRHRAFGAELLAEIDALKAERAHGSVGSDDLSSVIDLPTLPLRSQRRG